MAAPPPEPFLSAFTASTTRVVRRAEIYESDGSTAFCKQINLTGGSVNLDIGRDERRSFDVEISLEGCNHERHYFSPNDLWYDKIFKLFRGVDVGGSVWETQVGEFMIDSMSTQHFPNTMKIAGRDYAKKLLLDKFPAATAFAANLSVESVISTIATNGGITRQILPVTGKTLGKEYIFERGTERWKAIYEIALAHNYEIFFDERGYLVMREQRDPVTSPLVHSFFTGAGGNLASFEKRTEDSRIFNHVVIVGEKTDSVPVWAEAENNDASSPTRIAKIGRRTFEHVTSLVTTVPQAQDLADSLLKTKALESFNLNFGSLVAPWLEGGDIVEFIDPDPAPADPTRFLLAGLTIPMGLETMKSNGRRVTVVG